MAGLPPRDGADARTGSERRVHHDADQRPEGVRHRPVGGAGVLAGRRERHRAGDVAHVVRRRQRLRARIGDCRLPVRAGHPGARPQRPPLPQGRGLMAVVRLVRRAPLNLFLGAIAVMWLVPTFGLFLTSLMPKEDIAQQGWWTLFSKPSEATFQNYRDLFNNNDITSA